MDREKILIINFDGEGLDGQLRDVLHACPLYSFQIECAAVGGCPPAEREKRIAGLAALHRPSLVFFVSLREPLEAAAAVTGALGPGPEKAPVVGVLGECAPEDAFGLLGLGVEEFVVAPLNAGNTLPRVWRLLRGGRQERLMKEGLKQRLGMKRIIGDSPAFLKEVEKLPLVAQCDASVLISGETGTGKEVCARAIHYLSPRSDKPFVAVNCGAIPADLVENELFGHERGAYTGAASAQEGVIREADGGTLFLDEVDSLPLAAQVKLLRFLQEKEYRPLGSAKTRKANVRIVAAANVDFEEAVRAGRLRQDLYFRLNVIPLNIPPLRDRQEDVLLLAHHFLRRYAAELNRPPMTLAPDASGLLLQHDWPGNVRELEHVIERTVVLTESPVIRAADLLLTRKVEADSEESFREGKRRIVAQFERSYIQRLLVAYDGNISRAASAARKNRRAFWELIRKHRIDVSEFKLESP